MDCEDGKVQLSRHEAEALKANVGRDKGKDMRIYECPKCHAYHLTKKSQRRIYD